VTFTGAVPRVRSEEHWSWADVFVLPTLSDGFAITQLEAMARGLPVIATRRCGEVVEDGRSGILIEARDAEGLSNALLRLAGNPEELASMSQAALVRVRDFSLARYADRLIGKLEVGYEVKS
jgi:glycosyltransferase involved in cell wall biosynthesis